MRLNNPVKSVKRIVIDKAPIEAQLIVTRRCNLSCGYCSEYDNFSQPIPLDLMKERIDALHRLKTVHISLLGGEPLLHPQIDDIVAYAGRQAQVSLTTNGLLLSEKMIQRLNDAGLSNMQISVDALRSDARGYIQKSFKSVEPKLQRLLQQAKFGINVNIVLCDGTKDDLRAMVDRLKELGVSVSIGLLHDEKGVIAITGADAVALWDYHYDNSNTIAHVEHDYGRQLLSGERPAWKCRAGARYIYVDEFGKAQYCSAQRGRLDKPITTYTKADLREQARSEKGCESGCAMFCSFRTSQLDNAPLDTVKAFYRVVRSVDLLNPEKLLRRDRHTVPASS
jgi:MoaA/NifB/PqqE/SkfB family radical SAM enzyme